MPRDAIESCHAVQDRGVCPANCIIPAISSIFVQNLANSHPPHPLHTHCTSPFPEIPYPLFSVSISRYEFTGMWVSSLPQLRAAGLRAGTWNVGFEFRVPVAGELVSPRVYREPCMVYEPRNTAETCELSVFFRLPSSSRVACRGRPGGPMHHFPVLEENLQGGSFSGVTACKVGSWALTKFDDHGRGLPAGQGEATGN